MAKTRVFGIRLNDRLAWAWERLGQAAIRQLIAPEGICVQCASGKARSNSRNGWFCYPCQDELDQMDLLPLPLVDQLEKQNKELRIHLKQLHSQLDTLQARQQQQDCQLSLFDDSYL